MAFWPIWMLKKERYSCSDCSWRPHAERWLSARILPLGRLPYLSLPPQTLPFCPLWPVNATVSGNAMPSWRRYVVFVNPPEFYSTLTFHHKELRKQFQIISELRAEIKTLQSDNLKLYEKVRYMQSYREDSGNRPVTQLDPLPPPSALPDGLGKYQTRYEEAMNPFEAFRGRVCCLLCQSHAPELT